MRKRQVTMEQLLSTNDPVVLSLAESLLREAGIDYFVADENVSAIEGSIGILPRRLLVPATAIKPARQLLTDAGLGAELDGLSDGAMSGS